MHDSHQRIVVTEPAATNYTRTGKFKTQSMLQLRFFHVLQEYAKEKPVKLNIAETIIQGFGVRKPTLIRTGPQGHVVSREGLISPEYCSPSIINLLIVFSANTRPGVPCAIVKQERKFKDCCMPLMSLKAGQIAWNRMLAQFHPVVLQRFVYNGSPCAFLLRVKYQPTLNNWSFEVLQNTCLIAGRADIDPYIELNAFLNQTGMRRLKPGRSIAQRFCVKTSNPLSFEFCAIEPIESVKTQVETLKQVLEKGYLSDYELSVLEIEADFLQDSSGRWCFISLHSYKTEIIKKFMMKADLKDMMSRLSPCLFTRTSLDREATPALRRHRTVMSADFDIVERLLVTEIMEDLGAKRR